MSYMLYITACTCPTLSRISGLKPSIHPLGHPIRWPPLSREPYNNNLIFPHWSFAKAAFLVVILDLVADMLGSQTRDYLVSVTSTGPSINYLHIIRKRTQTFTRQGMKKGGMWFLSQILTLSSVGGMRHDFDPMLYSKNWLASMDIM